jgi:hypothetical protein
MCMPAATIDASDNSGIPEKKTPGTEEVMTRPTISRVSEMPPLPVSVRQYEFLIDNLRISMALARIYDPSLDSYKIEVRPGGVMHVYDPAGLEGDMKLVRSTPGRRVYYVSGHFDFLKMRFNGRMVLAMSYSERLNKAGVLVDAATTSYIKLDSSFAGFFAKIAAFLFPKKVEGRIGRFTTAVKRVAFAVHDDPAGAYRRLAASREVGPRELREFAGMFLPGSL